MEILQEDLIKLALAVLVGGIIGAEREIRDKHIGFRTLICICTGAAIFTILSHKMSAQNGGDPQRIASAVVTGVGFIGAGAILRAQGSVRGFTTAVTVWLVASLGMAVGAGYYALAVISSIFILVILSLFPALEKFIDDLSDTRFYQITHDVEPRKIDEIKKIIAENDLKILSLKTKKEDSKLLTQISVKGSIANHDSAISKLVAKKYISDLDH